MVQPTTGNRIPTMTENLEKLFKEPTDNIFIQLFRYGFVGGTAFIVDYATLWIFTEYLGLHYQAGACAGFLAGLIVNYLLSISWVFNSPAEKNDVNTRVAEFIMFAIIGIIGLGLNALIMWIATDLIDIFYMVSKLISTGIVFMWNFLGRHFLMSKFSTSMSCKS